jgi:TonB family protein
MTHPTHTMTTFAIRSSTLCLLGLVLGGLLTGCGSSGPVVGRGIEKRVYLLKGERVDQPPEIIGGYDEVEKAQKYPKAAEEDDAYGVIWLQCTISASGNPTRIQLAQGGHPALETEALNVIQRLEFRPALSNGAPVPSQIQIPVIFQGPYAKPEKSN